MEKEPQQERAFKKIELFKTLIIDGDMDQFEVYAMVLEIINEYGLDYSIKQFQEEIMAAFLQRREG
jgi:hypothetical protein